MNDRVIHTDISMQIVARDNAVHLLFSRTNSDSVGPVPALTDNMLIDPETAMLAAGLMAEMAFEADPGLKPIGPKLKASLIETHRAKLIPRLKVVLNSLREKKTVSNEQLGIQLLDIFCHEVFT